MLFQTCIVIVRGLPQDSTEDTVLNYFENSRRSKGGAVEEVKIEGNVARVKFESSEGNLNNIMTFLRSILFSHRAEDVLNNYSMIHGYETIDIQGVDFIHLKFNKHEWNNWYVKMAPNYRPIFPTLFCKNKRNVSVREIFFGCVLILTRTLMMAKPIKTLELHYLMIHILIINHYSMSARWTWDGK